MKLRYLLPLFLTIALAASAATVWIAVALAGSLERVAEAEQRRFESIVLADELRQSSDDLTRFARMFVQTGDERFGILMILLIIWAFWAGQPGGDDQVAASDPKVAVVTDWLQANGGRAARSIAPAPDWANGSRLTVSPSL